MTTNRDAVTADPGEDYSSPRPSAPGLMIVWEDGQPADRVFTLDEGPSTFGRNESAQVQVDDAAASKCHVEIRRTTGGFGIRDLESKNGVYVDTKRITNEVTEVLPRVVRFGNTVMLFVDDITPYTASVGMDIVDGIVRGPATALAYSIVRLAGRESLTTLITGESGTGKEDLAKVYHQERSLARKRAEQRVGMLVAVNCAGLEAGRADADLFGAMKGAYTGAHADMRGHFDRADGGTLFLDELGALKDDVQAKLLRVLETKMVTPLGGAREHPVDVAIVAATNANLEEAVMRGTFRHDLLVRLSRERASLPPLRKRAEEIPTIATFAAAAITHKKLSAMLIEECVFRAWRGGNHRALVQAIERAARLAKTDDSPPEIVKQQLPDPSPWDGWDVAPAPPLAARILSQREVKEEAFVRAYMKSGNVDQAALEADISRSTGFEIVKRRGLKE